MTRLVEIVPSQADIKFGKAKFHPFPLFELRFSIFEFRSNWHTNETSPAPVFRDSATVYNDRLKHVLHG